MIRAIALALVIAIATPVVALDNSIRPVARGDFVDDPLTRPMARRAAVPVTPSAPVVDTGRVVTPDLRPNLRPYDRPELARGAATLPQLRAEQNLFAFSPTAPAFSRHPNARSAAFIQAMADRQAAITRGQVCRDPAIQGDAIGRVEGRGQCGIENAVRVKSVLGVQLQPAARMDCTTANALKRWVDEGLNPATNNQADSLRVVSDYSCRFRNSAASGKLSEHSFGRAIDIAAIRLKDGRIMELLSGWNSQRDGPAWRQMWRAACGPFGTVLGPESNRFHRDHFHFDTARYRSGSYCR
ncbi:MAG: extensin family protein [Pseudomonadota bacterium]